MTERQTQVELMIYGRLSYTYVHKEYEKDGKKQGFCTHVLIDPATPADPRIGAKSGAEYIQLIKDAQRTVASGAWANTQAVLTELAAKCKLALHDGNVEKASNSDYKDKFYLSANSKKQPLLIESRDGVNVKLTEADGRPYSGCWGFVKVAIWAQSPDGKPSEYGKRINTQLQGIQFIKHDTAFGGGGKVADVSEFGVVAGEADAAAPPAAQAAGGRSLF